MHPRRHPIPVALVCAASLAAAPPVPADRSVGPPAPAPKDSSIRTTQTPVPADRSLAPRVAVVAPRLIGFPDAALAGALAGQLRRGAGRGPVVLLPADAVDRAAAGACEDSCLRALRATLRADYVLRSEISRVDRDHAVRLELVDEANLRVAATVEATCELCGLEELQVFAADQAARLVGPLAVAGPPPARLELDSLPVGAAVAIDGRPVGVTPLILDVADGPRVVRMSHAGRVTEERAVAASPGVQVRVHLSLRRAPVPPAPPRGGYALLFSGLAPAVAGVALLAIDGRAPAGRCASGPYDAAGRCVHSFDTDWGGAGLLAAGALLVTTGALLLAGRRARAARVRAGVGAGLVLRASF